MVNSAFFDNRCYPYGPDLGGAAIRAYGMYTGSPVYITHDTFTDNICSNGGALSGLDANFDVTNSLLMGNKAIGWGANPARRGTPGGGSGGAIYADGNHYNLFIDGTVLRDNSAREGGGAIFFVVNAGGGTLKIEHSTLQDNPSGEFQNAPGIFDHVDGRDRRAGRVRLDDQLSRAFLATTLHGAQDGRHEERILLRRHAAQVEQQAAGLQAAHYGGQFPARHARGTAQRHGQ